MPQRNVPKHLRKKKKGHAPAHQNTFAFQHNPNSTKTSKIMDLPNVHVCRRCHDKIEWRKKYRKYKSRTQPGKCNICQQKRVMAAYHTICGKCSETDKAKKLVKEHLLTNPPKQHQSTGNTDHHQDNDDPERVEEENGKNMESIGEEAEEQLEVNAEPANSTEEEPEASAASTRKEGRRACCMCVKEFALPDPADEPKEEDPLTSGKKLTLRQRKTLERQKEAAKKKQTTTSRKKQDDNTDPANDNQRQDNPFVDSDSDGDFDPLVDSDEDEDDPFLKAVGGKLLTGEAYQKALMEKEQRQA